MCETIDLFKLNYVSVDPPVCIDWEAWSPCSSSCTDGIRTRGCKDNPGNATGTEICNISPHGKLSFKNRHLTLADLD